MILTTQHNDNGRTGANLNETTLNTSNVNPKQFGKLFSRRVIGAIYAQPLYVARVSIPRKGIRNVVYVATMYNHVYAFDADNPNASTPLWGPVALGPAIPLPDPNIGPGGHLGLGAYKDISVEVGVVSTPVISLSRRALYVVAATKERGRYYHRLHKLSLSTGKALHAPRTIAGSLRGHPFRSHRQLQRAALVLAGNIVYVTFASYADEDPYHGWIFGYTAGTLQRVGMFLSTPDGQRGGIWQAGQGPAADEHNNLYFMTGNGTFHHDGSNLGDCMVKLRPNLKVADWFSPHNNSALDGDDCDLGSAGVLLIPGTNLILGGGKEGKFYLVDRNHMGKFRPHDDNQIVQHFYAGRTPVGFKHHIHGAPVYWHGPKGRWIYVWPEHEALRAFKMTNGKFKTTPISKSTTKDPSNFPGGSMGMPGGFLSISARGRTGGTGIVWASHPYRGDANQQVVGGIVRAYDASNLRRELWNSKKVPSRDDIGNFAKFCPPTIANGKLYMASMGGIENKVVLRERAIEGPGLITMKGPALAIAWTGTDWDHHLNVMCSTDGQHFSGKVTLRETSPHGPGFAFGNGRAFLAWTGTDWHHHLNVISSPDCKTFGNKVTLADTSRDAPALAFGNGRLFLAWTGRDHHRSLNVMSSADGIVFGNKVTLPDNSFAGPALAFFGGKLYLLWAGTDNNRSLNIMESTDGIHFSNKQIFKDSSDFHPALVSNGMPHFVWTGRDISWPWALQERLNLMVSDGNVHHLGAKATYDDTSVAGPALAVFQEKVYMGWTGRDWDHHLNVAVLSRGHFAVYGLLKRR